MESLEMKYREGDVSEEEFRNAALEESLNILNAQNYQYIAKLGIGTFGCVYWLKDPRESTDLAAKIVLEDRVSASEVKIWPTLEHANILPRVKACHLPDAKTFVFLTPKCSGTLDESVEDFEFMLSEKAFSTAVGWLKDVLTGLQYLHSEGYCHLDLKGNNVLIDGSRAVLSDFGFLSKTEEHVTEYGAPFIYRPPEATEGAPLAGKPFDVWTVGLLALEMFTQQSLIRTVSLTSANSFHQHIYPAILHILEKKQFKAFLQTAFQNSTIQNSTINRIIDFIKGCLNLSPENRPDVKDLLAHKLLGEPESMALTRTNVWNQLTSHLRLQLLRKRKAVPGGNKKQADDKVGIVENAQMFVLYYDRISSKEQDVMSHKQTITNSQKTLALIQKAENSFQDITNNSPAPDNISEPMTTILETNIMQKSINKIQETVIAEDLLNTIQECAVAKYPVFVDETVITEDPVIIKVTPQQPVNNISDTVHPAQKTYSPDFVTDFHKFEQCLENQSVFFLRSTIPNLKLTSRRLKIIRWLRRKKNRFVRILRDCVPEMV